MILNCLLWSKLSKNLNVLYKDVAVLHAVLKSYPLSQHSWDWEGMIVNLRTPWAVQIVPSPILCNSYISLSCNKKNHSINKLKNRMFIFLYRVWFIMMAVDWEVWSFRRDRNQGLMTASTLCLNLRYVLMGQYLLPELRWVFPY